MVEEKVNDGYKRTEVGVIPSEWNSLKVEECVSIKTGSRNTQDKIDEGIYPFFVRSQQVENINSYSYDCEAVLTAGDGVGTGKVFHYINGKFDAHQRVYIMTNFKDITGKYFYYYFSNYFYNEVIKYTAKTSVDSVRRDMIAKMLLPIPTLNEQKSIAESIEEIDNLLQSLEKLIDKKKKIKQGTMQQLLTGKKRLPGFSDSWNKYKISDIAVVGRGRVISHKEIFNSFNKIYPVYSSQTTNNGIMGYIDTYDFEGDYITWTTDGVNAGKVFSRRGRFNCTNVCGTIKLKSDDHTFIAMALDNVTDKYVSKNLANPKLMNDVMKRIEIKLPDINEQKAIAKVFLDINSEIETLQQKLEKYKKIKQGMMQELLTGRIRLI